LDTFGIGICQSFLGDFKILFKGNKYFGKSAEIILTTFIQNDILIPSNLIGIKTIGIKLVGIKLVGIISIGI
jgi:hypothetical protein